MKHRIADLLDVPALQSLLDSLYASSKIPSAIIDNEGKVLAGSGWQDACTKFHRVHPDVRKLCVESDRRVVERIDEARPAVAYTCPQGLTDSATPLVVGGAHVANVFTGQLFLAPPDIGFFRSQARRYGWDEEAYIGAIRKVPVISEEALRENISFIARFTEMLAESGLKRLGEREALDKLRESEEIFRCFMEHSPVYVFFKDENIRALRLSRNFEAMLGMPVAEMLGRNMDDLFPSGLAKEMIADDMRVMKEGKPVTVEEEFNGRSYSTIKFPVFIDGKPRYLAGYTIDVTERNEAEKMLKTQLAFREGVIDGAAEGICVCNGTPDYPFVLFTVWNNRMTEITGYGMDEINRLGWYQCLYPDPDVQGRARDRMDRMRQGDNLKGEEWEITRSDGDKRQVSISTSVLDEQDKTVHVLALIQDVTERKRAEGEKRKLEEQVRWAQKMESLGVLAGGIAHDFNNILMAVLGHAELALKETSPTSPVRGNLSGITTAAQRAADLCRQMLAYAGKASFALERVGLRDLVEEMTHLLKAAVSKMAILNLNLERGLPPIQADPSQILQVAMNLIINASEAIGDRSGVITVSVGATLCDDEYLRKTELPEALAPGLYVHLEVTDTGVGMDAETRSRIFDPFFSTKFTGRGLGLAAVLGIVRAHKGALKVHSEPGKGTTFKVLFPALEGEVERVRAEGPSTPSDWRGKGTVLLVDDEESLVALGARMLEHLGFAVLTAADGAQAVEIYRQRGEEIDLVLMDLTMPRMDGAEAFGELRRLDPDVRVILASGYDTDDVAPRFAGKGLAGVLQKPYTLARLRETLAGLTPKRL